MRYVTDDILHSQLDEYARTGRPITVNFRELVHWMPSSERATHFIHPYPAKLLPQIPHFFLANKVLSSPGATVLDPFCGSGTVLLEAVLTGRNAMGADANPLARLISLAKVKPIQPSRIQVELRGILSRIPKCDDGPWPSVVNIRHWFYPHVITQLLKIRTAIEVIDDAELRTFFLVCLSNCVRRVSLADPRLSVPVRLKKDQYPLGHWLRDSTNARLRSLRRQNVTAAFDDVVQTNTARMASLVELADPGYAATVIGSDARDLRNEFNARGIVGRKVPKDSVDLVITSPPYVGAQKYIRASSLSLGWLGLTGGHTLRQLEDANIGREHYPKREVDRQMKTGIETADLELEGIRRKNALRAHIAASYLAEMRAAICEAARVLRPGGHVVLVTANNQICGAEFKTQEFLEAIANSLGLVTKLKLVDAIKSRGLMTRRNKTAGIISREWVTLFRKPERCSA